MMQQPMMQQPMGQPMMQQPMGQPMMQPPMQPMMQPPMQPGYGPPPGQHTTVVTNQVHHSGPPPKECGPTTCLITFILCFFIGPFALFSCFCPCVEKGGSRGHGHHRGGHYGGDGGDG